MALFSSIPHHGTFCRGYNLGLVLAAGTLVVANAVIIPPNIDSSVDTSRMRITVFAEGLNFPKSMTRLSDGSLLVATSDPKPSNGSLFRSTGNLIRLVDADHNGHADGPGTSLYNGLPGLLTGLRRIDQLVFVTSSAAGERQISILRTGSNAGDPLTHLDSIQIPIPANWSHSTSGLAVRKTPGQPGSYDVFFNVGSKENAVSTTDTVPLSGLIQGTVGADSIYKVTIQDHGNHVTASDLTQIATGLRNAAGILVHPKTGDLYFSDNGIDGNQTPISADELNRIAAADIGGVVEDFGFAGDYIQHRTGTRIGSGSIQPENVFQPIPDPFTGSQSTGASELAVVPESFDSAGIGDGIFVGFHGVLQRGGLSNSKNPLALYDFGSDTYIHFIGNAEPNIGHLDGLLSTEDSLFIADLAYTGGLGRADAGKGVIYQIYVQGVPDSDFTLLGMSMGLIALAGKRRFFDQ